MVWASSASAWSSNRNARWPPTGTEGTAAFNVNSWDCTRHAAAPTGFYEIDEDQHAVIVLRIDHRSGVYRTRETARMTFSQTHHPSRS